MLLRRRTVVPVLLAGAALVAPTLAAAPAASAEPRAQHSGDRPLRPGASGADVRELQLLLREAGFEVAVTGIFDTATERAVERFQAAARLYPSGTVGRKTVAALRAATKSAAAPRTGGFSRETAAEKRNGLGDRLPVRLGMSGRDIRMLQDFLRRAGFANSPKHGQFDRATRRAVKAFERSQQRTVDGVVSAGDVDALRTLIHANFAKADPALALAAARIVPGDRAQIDAQGFALAPADAPPAVHQIIAAGNLIAHKPYRYGGGHGSWEDTGYDCSGSVSYALRGAGLLGRPLASSGYFDWGDPGPGTWVTLYTNAGHIYMVVAGLRFDTSGRSGSGSRWQKAPRAATGFQVRHPIGL